MLFLLCSSFKVRLLASYLLIFVEFCCFLSIVVGWSPRTPSRSRRVLLCVASLACCPMNADHERANRYREVTVRFFYPPPLRCFSRGCKHGDALSNAFFCFEPYSHPHSAAQILKVSLPPTW
ncbi:unnamed protein product, partial [Discosporangium mesarthrocarpum]